VAAEEAIGISVTRIPDEYKARITTKVTGK
jgi:hypothetical protein